MTRQQASFVFLNRFYWPDHAATAQQLTDLAEDVAAAGHDVTVITGRGAYEREGGRLAREEWRNGVRILRVAAGPSSRHNLWSRLAGYAWFGVAAATRALRLRVDVVVALCDPPFLHVIAVLCRAFRGSRAVYYVQDLYPDIAAALGVMPERGRMHRVARRAAAFLNRRSDAVVTLGARMAARVVANGARSERTVVCPNWADTAAIVPVPHEENPFRAMHGLAGRFVVQYSGNAGRAHVFDAVLGAAERLRAREDVVFLFIGGGKRMPEIRAEAARRGLTNVRFLGYQPREMLRHSLSAADAALVTENPDVVGMLVPSKAYGILASGRPLLFVGAQDSDVATLVRETGAGYVVDPDDSAALAGSIERLADDAALCERLGGSARAAAETTYARDVRTTAWLAAVGRVLQSGRAHFAEPARGGSRQPARRMRHMIAVPALTGAGTETES